jgi:hypothetical protein
MNTKKKNKGCIKIQSGHHSVRCTGGTDATGSNIEYIPAKIKAAIDSLYARSYLFSNMFSHPH